MRKYFLSFGLLLTMGLATVGCTKDDVKEDTFASEKVKEVGMSRDNPGSVVILYESFDFLIGIHYSGVISFPCYNRISSDWQPINYYGYDPRIAYQYAAYSVGKVNGLSEITLKYNSVNEMVMKYIYDFGYNGLPLVENGGYVLFHNTDNGIQYIRIWIKSYTTDSNKNINFITVQYQVF